VDKIARGTVSKHADGGADSGEGPDGQDQGAGGEPADGAGFSGDLILDEFAFHEDSKAIWEAAEPILASNPDFLCRMHRREREA